MSLGKLIKDPALPVANPTVSYWQTPPDARLLKIQSSPLPSDADIVVVGSGISACSVVHGLLTGGFSGKIVVLEAREICSGATGRNGGRVHVHAMKDFDRFRRQFDDATAEKIVRFQMMHRKALDAVVESLRPEHRKRASLRDTDAVAAVFSEEELEHTKKLLAEFEAALPDCVGQWRMISAEEVQQKYKIKNATGGVVYKAGAAWPYRLITGVFVELLEKHSGRLFLESNTPVQRVAKESGSDLPYRVITRRGIVKAKHVVYCTEAHTAHVLPKFKGILVPRREQLTVQTPGNAFPDHRGRRSYNLNWDLGRDYLHQNAETGDLIIGGTDHGGFEGARLSYGVSTDAVEEVPDKIHLGGLMREVFGKEHWGEVPAGKETIKASWSGILGHSLDHVPFVGLLPDEALDGRRAGDRENGAEWICVGFGGYGMTNCWLSGAALSQQILGHKIPSWFPEPFVISPSRISQLQTRVAEIGGTEKHLRALL